MLLVVVDRDPESCTYGKLFSREDVVFKLSSDVTSCSRVIAQILQTWKTVFLPKLIEAVINTQTNNG